MVVKCFLTLKQIIMSNKIFALFALLIGIVYFCLFAYDIEYHRDLITCFWLLNSQIWFMISLRLWILHDKNN